MRAVLAAGASDAERAQIVSDDVADRRAVVDDQHAPTRETRRGRGDRVRRLLRELQQQGERAARAGLAVDDDLSVHELGQALHDGEPEARAAVEARGRDVALRERLEDHRLALRRDADAAVGDGELDRGVRSAVRDRAGADDHLTPLGELERVAEQIGQDLPQAIRVAAEEARHARVERGGELEALAMGALGEELDDLLDRLPQIEVDHLELELAGFHLREVEHVVDDAEERRAARPERLHVLALLVVEAGVEEERAHADDAVERRPHFVAHDREELALRERRRLGHLLGEHELVGAPRGGLGALLLAQVAADGGEPRRLAGRRVSHEEEVHRDGDRIPGCEVPPAKLADPAAVAEDRGNDDVAEMRPVVGKHEVVEGQVAERDDRCQPDETPTRRVHEADLAGEARETDEVVRVLDDGREEAAVAFGALLLGQVADDADEHAVLLAGRDCAERETERKDATVAAARDELEHAVPPSRGAREHAADRRMVAPGDAAREQACDARPACLRERNAEHPDGGGIERRDRPVGVDGDDALGGVVEHGAHAGFARVGGAARDQRPEALVASRRPFPAHSHGRPDRE